jgi:hypothetical protein
MSRLRRRPLLLAAIVLVLLLVAVLIAVLSGSDDEGKDDGAAKVLIPVALPGPDVTVVADPDQVLDPEEQREARDGGLDLHEDQRDETPPGVPPEVLKAGDRKTDELVRKERLRLERPGGAQNYQCQNRPVRNQSGLSGRQHGVAMHFTVSNPGSLFAIRGLFDRASFGASSNYGWDWGSPRGNYCHVWVPVGRKAWAQGRANSAYVSIEVHTKDRPRASWVANLKDGRLASLVRDLAKRTGAPLKLVDPRGCVFPPGITDHDRLECGNTHWDVGKNFPWDYFMRQVRSGVSPSRLTKRQAVACDLLNFHRSKARAAGRYSPGRLRRARELKRRIPSGRCLRKG